jgi:hypothetical protein
VITIGIDPHKRSLTAAALDPHSRLLGQLRLPATGIAQPLVAAGEQVVDVPAKLAARARLLGTSSARKTDLADACSVAAAALHHRRPAGRRCRRAAGAVGGGAAAS